MCSRDYRQDGTVCGAWQLYPEPILLIFLQFQCGSDKLIPQAGCNFEVKCTVLPVECKMFSWQSACEAAIHLQDYKTEGLTSVM